MSSLELDRADVVFSGGVVHTVDVDNNIAQAIAIRDGRILVVGSAAAVLASAGPETPTATS